MNRFMKAVSTAGIAVLLSFNGTAVNAATPTETLYDGGETIPVDAKIGLTMDTLGNIAQTEEADPEVFFQVNLDTSKLADDLNNAITTDKAYLSANFSVTVKGINMIPYLTFQKYYDFQPTDDMTEEETINTFNSLRADIEKMFSGSALDVFHVNDFDYDEDANSFTVYFATNNGMRKYEGPTASVASTSNYFTKADMVTALRGWLTITSSAPTTEEFASVGLSLIHI